jgi:aspartate carbamoyltransferase catalytic subunit
MTLLDSRPDTAASLSPTETPFHILDARQFSRQWLEQKLFPLAARLQATPLEQLPRVLSGKRLFYLLYEPSTRTRVSFETAATLLGGHVTGMDSHEHRPEDERLEDRIKILNQYQYDFLLLRYDQEGGASTAAKIAQMPVINAGDGPGQHPTQALLDIYTMWRELPSIEGCRIALVGDLSYQRSTNSLAYLLTRFPNVRVFLVSPRMLKMREEVRTYLLHNEVDVVEVDDLREIAAELDVLYLTRAMGSRFEHAQRFDGRRGVYNVNAELLARLPEHARILHPLPRGDELPQEFDADPRVACFRQAGNGLYIRMALLTLIAQAASEVNRFSIPGETVHNQAYL